MISLNLVDKWHFRNESSEEDTEYPKFRNKSGWESPRDARSPHVEVFLNLVQADIEKIDANGKNYPNISKPEREALENLAKDRSIIIKSADKGSYVVLWDRDDYLCEANRQLCDTKVYQQVDIDSDVIADLVKYSNDFFASLYTQQLIGKK